jgi:hypothetical protein
MAKSIKHKISFNKYHRVRYKGNKLVSVRVVKDGVYITHVVWSFTSNGFVYTSVRDLSKPYISNENIATI